MTRRKVRRRPQRSKLRYPVTLRAMYVYIYRQVGQEDR